jgi:hypothetical protein
LAVVFIAVEVHSGYSVYRGYNKLEVLAFQESGAFIQDMGLQAYLNPLYYVQPAVIFFPCMVYSGRVSGIVQVELKVPVGIINIQVVGYGNFYNISFYCPKAHFFHSGMLLSSEKALYVHGNRKTIPFPRFSRTNAILLVCSEVVKGAGEL